MPQTADEQLMVLPPPLPDSFPEAKGDQPGEPPVIQGPDSPITEPPPEVSGLPPKPYPGFWQATGLFLIALLAMALLCIPIAVFDVIFKAALLKSPWALGLVSLVGNLLAVQIGRKHLGITWRELAGPFRLPSAILPSIAAITLGQLLITVLVVIWLIRMDPRLMSNETYGLDKDLIGAAFILVVIAPLTEELLFRGLFLRGFVPRYGLTKGILLGAAMFAAAHMHPTKLFGTFLLGAIFGWWYSKMGSIWPGVLGHALNNIAPVLAVVLAGKDSFNDKTVPPFSWVEPVLALIAIGLLLQGILTMRRYFDRSGNDSGPMSVPVESLVDSNEFE